MNTIRECIIQGLIKSVRDGTGLEEATVANYITEGKIKVAPTPDPRMGDYGVALHVVLKNYPRDKWDEIGSQIALRLLEYTRDACRLRRAVFLNGYVNIEVDYTYIFTSFMESLLTGRLSRELEAIGSGRTIVVEHTSANPVHPLHIGSGRNSVIGDTYARLLKHLGFTVVRLFYVNDLGRQVAVLAYGVRKLRSQGVTPGPGIKIDHWYGIVYALTNILIEMDKASHALRSLSLELGSLVNELATRLESLVGSGEVGELEIIHSKLTTILKRLYLKHDSAGTLRELYRGLGRLMKEKKELEPVLGEHYRRLSDLYTRYRELYREYMEYAKAWSNLCREHPDVCRGLMHGFKGYEEAEREIAEIMRMAEGGDPDARSFLRNVSSEVLKGFTETLSRLNVEFDGFDYESSDEVLQLSRSIVDKVLETPYARIVDGAVEVDLNKAGMEQEYVRALFHPDQPGRFILRRSDGTTLYVTRDIAYTLIKFKKHGAERVYNVIAVEQARAQKQLRAVLYMLGYKREADNLIHFSYEMVHLKGMRMSGRRGIYYTMDELLIDMEHAIVGKYLEETQGARRKSMGGYRDLVEAARALAVNNTRALLLSVEPGKVLSFDPARIREFEHGITVTYGLVRAQSVLRKLWGIEPLDNMDLVKANGVRELSSINVSELALNTEEKQLLEQLVGYPMVLREAYEYMRPDRLLEYAVELSLAFNRMYEKHRITNEPDPVKRAVRILLTIGVFQVLSNLADIMGFHKLRRL